MYFNFKQWYSYVVTLYTYMVNETHLGVILTMLKIGHNYLLWDELYTGYDLVLINYPIYYIVIVTNEIHVD